MVSVAEDVSKFGRARLDDGRGDEEAGGGVEGGEDLREVVGNIL